MSYVQLSEGGFNRGGFQSRSLPTPDSMGMPKLSQNARNRTREQNVLCLKHLLSSRRWLSATGSCQCTACKTARMRRERACLERAARADVTKQTFRKHVHA